MSAVLSPLSLAAQNEAGTPYYGLVWLALASLAYTDEDETVIKNVGTDLPKAIAALPDPPAPRGFAQPAPGTWGRWETTWGPVVDWDNSNLMYVASYIEIASGLPIFIGISIRGTDTQEHRQVVGLLQQLYEDLGVDKKVAWTHVVDDPAAPCTDGASSSDIAIAKGTCEGLKILRQMSAPLPGSTGGIDVLSFARQRAQTCAGVPFIVTGHSLGGCQTTAMAMFLADALDAEGVKANICPHAFAPPTSGTPAFAAKFDTRFPHGHLWWNTLDVVPNAFQNIAHAPGTTPSLTNIRGFWQAHGGPAIDDVEKIALDAFILVDHGYAHPQANLQTLAGAVVTPGASAGCKNDWVTQLMIQHFPPQYHYLISTQLAGTVAAYPLPSYGGACFQVPPVS